MFKILIIILLTFVSVSVSAQKKSTITDADTIVITAIHQIDADMQGEGKILTYAIKHQLQGSYSVDLTINEKGAVVSVFFQSKPEVEIKQLTLFREFLNNYTFNFKTPKGRKYKFNYQFNF